MLAVRQHGVAGLPQLEALGLSARAVQHRAASGRLRRIHQGVYALGPGAPVLDGLRLAAVLAGGSGALLSHVTAAALWGIRGSDSGPLHVTAPSDRRSATGIAVHRTRWFAPEDRAAIRGIPVTSVARTLVDLASVISPGALARALHEAEVLRLLDVPSLEAALGRSGGRRGSAALRTLLSKPSPVSCEGAFDERFLALCQEYRLPVPALHVHLPAGNRLVEVDALWSEPRVCVELDGARFHHTRRAFRADRERDLALAAEGYLVVRLTWDHVTREGARVADDLQRVLEARTPALGR